MLSSAEARERELIHGELQIVEPEETATPRKIIGAAPGRSWLRRHGELLCALLSGGLLLAAVFLRHEPGDRLTAYHACVYLAFGLGFGFGVAEAWGALRQGKLDIHFLMVLGAVLALLVQKEMEGAVLLFLFTLSGALEQYAMERTRTALESLVKLFPKEARLLLPDGSQKTVRLEMLRVGDRVLVRPGDTVPADGTILEGESSLDESAITGEYLAREKGPGETVFAGTMNQGGRLVVEVAKPAHDTTLARIIHLVGEAREEKAPVERLFDRIGTIYTLVVLTGSAASALLLRQAGLVPTWSEAVYRAITLLIVASPCALIISTPVVLLSAIATCARRGVVFKGGRHIESLAHLKSLMFDKTGTLTRGQVQLVGIEYVNATHALLHCDLPGVLSDHPEADERGEPSPVIAAEVARHGAEVCTHACMRGCRAAAEFAQCGEIEREPAEMARLLLRVAASLEANSTHPLAQAVMRAAQEAEISPWRVEEFKQQAGSGVRGSIDGQLAILGSPAMLDGLCHTLSVTRLCARLREVERQGQTAVVLHYAGRTGLLKFQDTLRPESRETVAALHELGVRPLVMLTGDNRRVADAVAREVGIDEVHSELLPEQKLRQVETLVREHRVVGMVGDGINDAPALARATVGIAMGSIGSDTALEAADVVLLSDNIERLPWLVKVARRAHVVMVQNIIFSLMVILVLIVASLGGVVGLPLGVVGHEGSTILVVFNGLRLLMDRGAR